MRAETAIASATDARASGRAPSSSRSNQRIFWMSSMSSFSDRPAITRTAVGAISVKGMSERMKRISAT